MVEATWQRIVLEEFLPAIGVPTAAVRAAAPKLDGNAMSLEFHSVAARFGDDLVPNCAGNVCLLDIFGAETALGVAPDGTYDAAAASAKLDSVLSTFATTPAAAVDGRASDFMRNTVFGQFGFDIVTTNLFRGRELFAQPYAELAKCYGVTPDATVRRRGL